MLAGQTKKIWAGKPTSICDTGALAVLLAVSFISALICIRRLRGYVSGHSFYIFAWYGIALGAIILAVMW